ncbi:MAG: hypothetical protein COW00_08405 [Bdellovibrio sp. CG12_big_fil_rev_8_21_14_0_65_39_13]|nr:MAG: hypothetical protein COW00_08405 [Bdellovibrio sp. CG12_big_fil_rev_8_21_14_0_65_39_13]PIR32814.1 MAG: hypothetical protein COV37_18670 [Bdellovibrio sp. CG11_big_fil_rev_8_21_14_0_20_39_38]
MKKNTMKTNHVIYYVDDSIELLKAFSFFAETYGCEVITYNDPFEFLDKANAISHDKHILLVDLDFKLPNINGMKVIEAIKEDNYAGFASVYLFTGQELNQDILIGLRKFDSRRVAYLQKTNENFIYLLEKILGPGSADEDVGIKK